MSQLLIASAGAGKTTFIVQTAIEKANSGISVLVTTFTEACEEEIREKVIERNGCVPSKMTIITWFSFLISHGIKPFQGCLFDDGIKGMILVEGKSGFKGTTRAGRPIYWGEKDFEKYYFNNSRKIYSDKLSQLVIRCNEKSQGKVVSRISRCFNSIFIDEIQDLAGYDLDIICALINSNSEVSLVCDPRQATYSTHSSTKYKKYRKSKITDFFKDKKVNIEIDTHSLTTNHRCFSSICEFSNHLYPDFPEASSSERDGTGHDGVFLISKEHLDAYLNEFKPVQLRDSKKTVVNDNFQALNFGQSKGLTLDRVVIYPSRPMIDWFIDNESTIKDIARSKLYVALTRAKHSVALVMTDEQIKKIKDIPIYIPQSLARTT